MKKRWSISRTVVLRTLCKDDFQPFLPPAGLPVKSEAATSPLEICNILVKHDPISIDVGDDTYSVESRSLARRFSKDTSVADWRRAVHEDMEFWSDDEAAGSEESYQSIAQELWNGFQLN